MAVECPECGCEDLATYRKASAFGRPVDWLICNHCGRKFRSPGEVANGVVFYFVITRCPECNSGLTRVTSTRRPHRYHRCQQCRATFQSVEKVVDPDQIRLE